MTVSLVEIDEIDAKILEELLKDARTSFSDIAKSCGVSTNTIGKHFKKLQQSGVITGTSTITCSEELEFQFPLSVDINVESGEEKKILEILKKMSNIRSQHQVIGKYDIHTMFHVSSFNEIGEIRDSITKEKTVKRVGLTATLHFLGFFPENLTLYPTETKNNG